MPLVYDLWFVREYPDREDTELQIGIYSTEADAESAIVALKGQPGFRDFQKGFQKREVRLNETQWTNGFISVIGPPPKGADGEIADLPAFMEDYLPGGPKFDGHHFELLRKHS